MDPDIVRSLEREIEAAVAKVLARMKDAPIEPSTRTAHLMAKAAVTVYETAVENAMRPPR